VSTYVPLTIATPRTIASAVSAARSFRPARPFSATLNTLRVQALHDGENLGRGYFRSVLDDQPVGEEEHAVGDRSGA
jgi:hypothetical protein